MLPDSQMMHLVPLLFPPHIYMTLFSEKNKLVCLGASARLCYPSHFCSRRRSPKIEVLFDRVSSRRPASCAHPSRPLPLSPAVRRVVRNVWRETQVDVGNVRQSGRNVAEASQQQSAAGCPRLNTSYYLPSLLAASRKHCSLALCVCV